MGSFLDGFTSIDELMEVQLLLLNKLLNKMNLNNQLLAYWIQTQSQIPASVDGDRPAVPLSLGGEKYKTFVYRASGLSGDGIIFEKRITGVISELLLLSTYGVSGNDDFSIKITSDNDVLVDTTYSNLTTSSNYEKGMTAFNDETKYVLQFQDIAFSNSIEVLVYNNNATFDNVVVKYQQLVE